MLRILIVFMVVSSMCARADDTTVFAPDPAISVCEQYSLQAADMIPRWYGEGRVDLLNAFLEDWYATCGDLEQVRRCRLLLAIDNETFSEELYSDNVVPSMAGYHTSAEQSASEDDWPECFRMVADDPDPDLRLFAFTEELAGSLRARTEPGSLEHLWVRFYSGDRTAVFRDLKMH